MNLTYSMAKSSDRQRPLFRHPFAIKVEVVVLVLCFDSKAVVFDDIFSIYNHLGREKSFKLNFLLFYSEISKAAIAE